MFPLLQRKGRVLLLDDDAAMRRLVSLLLKRAGYRVEAVAHGNEVIERLGHEEYDAILLDLMMPHEGGMTVMSHLRATDPTMLRRVILVTGAPDSLLQTFEGEIFAAVRKPFEAQELTAAVDRLTGAA